MPWYHSPFVFILIILWIGAAPAFVVGQWFTRYPIVGLAWVTWFAFVFCAALGFTT